MLLVWISCSWFLFFAFSLYFNISVFPMCVCVFFFIIYIDSVPFAYRVSFVFSHRLFSSRTDNLSSRDLSQCLFSVLSTQLLFLLCVSLSRASLLIYSSLSCIFSPPARSGALPSSPARLILAPASPPLLNLPTCQHHLSLFPSAYHSNDFSWASLFPSSGAAGVLIRSSCWRFRAGVSEAFHPSIHPSVSTPCNYLVSERTV